MPGVIQFFLLTRIRSYSGYGINVTYIQNQNMTKYDPCKFHITKYKFLLLF